MITDLEMTIGALQMRDGQIARLKGELRNLQEILVDHDRALEMVQAEARKQVYESLGIDTSSPEATEADIAAILWLLKERHEAFANLGPSGAAR